MKLRLRIFHEIEIWIPSIAQSIVSCENSQDENNNKQNWITGLDTVDSSVACIVCMGYNLALNRISISISAKYLNLNLSFSDMHLLVSMVNVSMLDTAHCYLETTCRINSAYKSVVNPLFHSTLSLILKCVISLHIPKWTVRLLYWENNAYMYWVKEQLCLKLLVAEAACAASAYLSSVLL